MPVIPSHSLLNSRETIYLAAVVACAAVSVTGIVLLYKHYSACDLNFAFITVTVVASIILTGLSGTTSNERDIIAQLLTHANMVTVTSWANVGLLPPSALALYLVLLCYQSVHSNPDGTCTEVNLTSFKAQQSSVVINALVAAITITWTGWQTSSTDSQIFTFGNQKPQSDDESEEDDGDLESIGLTNTRRRKHRRALRDAESKGVPDYQFHLLMVLASLYMAMVLTNWGSSDGYVASCCLVIDSS